MADDKFEVKEPGFRVMGTSLFYPLVGVDKFKQSDCALIAAVTDMDWDKWAKLAKKHGLDNVQVRQGFFAVAAQRARGEDADEIVEFVNDLPLVGGITLEFPPDMLKGADAGPPEEGATEGLAT